MAATEQDQLLAYLAQQRYVTRLAAYGLTTDEATSTPSVSTLSVAGIIKHLAATERTWIRLIVARELEPGAEAASDDATFTLVDGQTLDDVLAAYGTVATETDAAVREVIDLNTTVPTPTDVPWFPVPWTVRWVLLHLIEETARHAGQADIIRESIDGASAAALMAASEDWPTSPWLEPWKRRAPAAS